MPALGADIKFGRGDRIGACFTWFLIFPLIIQCSEVCSLLGILSMVLQMCGSPKGWGCSREPCLHFENLEGIQWDLRWDQQTWWWATIFFLVLNVLGPLENSNFVKSLKFLYFIWPSILWGSLCFTGENTNSRRLHITWAESWKCQSQASGLGCIAGYGDECLESQHVGDRGTKIATSFRPSWSIQHRAVYWC